MAREEEGHLLSGKCTVYGDLTQNYSDLTDIDSLVQFFSQVLERRDDLDRRDHQEILQTPVGRGTSTNVGANPGYIPGYACSMS